MHWKSLRRQVRVRGIVTREDGPAADEYYNSRSLKSRLGAWASDQSRPLENREIFETRFAEMSQRFEGSGVPRPPHWSGYCLTPARFEFWQDRAHRLHERRTFVRNGDEWTEGLLYP